MAVTLYKWTAKDQVEQLEQYLVQNTPSSSSNLGFHLGMDKPVGIWSSHVDSFNTSDVVVWIWDYKEGIRVFVNTEFVLDNAELMPGARDHAYGNELNDIRMFKSENEEGLYRQSLQVLSKAMTSFMNQREIVEPIFGDVSLLWLPVFHKLMQLTLNLPHCKLARQASLPIPHVKMPDHLELSTIASDKDILTVQRNNKYTFSYEYIKKCSRLSSAVRRNHDKELVAWTMTHPDRISSTKDQCKARTEIYVIVSIGALYVLPEYRRQGLAEAVVLDISRVYVDYFKQKLPDVPLSQLYFNVFIERTNRPSLGLF